MNDLFELKLISPHPFRWYWHFSCPRQRNGMEACWWRIIKRDIGKYWKVQFERFREYDFNLCCSQLKKRQHIKIRGPPKRRLRDLFQACTHAALPDFLTFRQPYSYQKLPLVVHWLLSLQRQPKVITLCVYKLAMDLRGYADFATDQLISAQSTL